MHESTERSSKLDSDLKRKSDEEFQETTLSSKDRNRSRKRMQESKSATSKNAFDLVHDDENASTQVVNLKIIPTLLEYKDY